MSNRRERRKNRMERRIARLFEVTNMAWLAPNVVEAWPEGDPEQYADCGVDGLHPDAVYIRTHGTSYTVTYKRGAIEWTGNNLRNAAMLFKVARLLMV